jgi:shikimate dehydrogenase
MISGKTQLAGLVGGDVSSSLSPFIHNYIARELGVDMAYAAFNVDSQNLGDAVKGAFALGIKGLNVTAPHKTAVIQLAGSVDDDAAEIGAVNLLKYEKNGYVGYNTDVFGFLKALEFYKALDGLSEVVILGAGGAAKAAAYALQSLPSVTSVTIVRRGEKIAGKGCLFVQAASAGACELLDIVPPKCLANFKTVFDMNYPKDNPWLGCVKSLGIKAFDGKAMLIYQAIKAFEIIWDKDVPSSLAEYLISNL